MVLKSNRRLALYANWDSYRLINPDHVWPDAHRADHSITKKRPKSPLSVIGFVTSLDIYTLVYSLLSGAPQSILLVRNARLE